MSSRDIIAEGLALAFLAGPWNRVALCQRAEEVLGERPRWLASLVQYLLRRFAYAPNDAVGSLCEAIRDAPSFWQSLGPGEPSCRLAKLLVAVPGMGVQRWRVPELVTTVDVASWLSLTPEQLDWFADVRGINAETGASALHHYSFHWLSKQRGGHRLVEAPKSRLKAIQRRIVREILDLVPAHDAAHGFVTGRSALTCARVHAGSDVILRLDLEEFFPSIGSPRVYRTFRAIGYPEAVARVLTGLSTLRVSAAVLGTAPRLAFGEHLDPVALAARARTRKRLRHRHLAQGAPTSPALANLASYGLDVRLTGAARALGLRYSRYADDLAFSGDDADLSRRAQRFEALVAAIALEEGFRINHHKTRVMRQSQAQRWLGLVINDRPSVARVERKRLEAILTNAARHGIASQNHERDPRFLESLRGRVAWVEHVNPGHARKLHQLLAACSQALPQDMPPSPLT